MSVASRSARKRCVTGEQRPFRFQSRSHQMGHKTTFPSNKINNLHGGEGSTSVALPPPPTTLSQFWLDAGLCNLAEQGGFWRFSGMMRTVLRGVMGGFAARGAAWSQGVCCEGEFGDNRDLFAKTAQRTGFLSVPVEGGAETISNISGLQVE